MKDEKRKEIMNQLLSENNGSFTFTAIETCNVLKISRTKLSRLQKEAKISFYKDGVSKSSATRFTVHDICDYILSSKVLKYEGVIL